MNTQEKKTYSYYAFISYSRKDEKWAQWLQQKLETYQTPSKLRKQDLNIPQKLYPVFRDKTDLTGGKLLEVLHEELDQSQYLIVICSPNSAGSPWVDKEIRHFVEQGRDSYIIPFIVDGEPMADNPALECYPESLRAGRERESEILGISVNELGREKAFLRVVAALLHLKFDQVVMRDRRRRMKQWAVAAAACLCLLIGVLAGVWYYMPHSAYYADFVSCYEVPQGVCPLTREERMGCERYCRIVNQQGKVVRVEVLNSLGNLVGIPAASVQDSYSSIDFFYDGSRLSRAELRNASGDLLLVKAYSSNLKAVDFQNSNDSSQAFALSTGQSGLGLCNDWNASTTKSEITRCINSYNENGYLIEERFMRDNRNTPVADNNGNYGLRYEREASGLVKSVTGLDENGKPHNSRYGYAMYVFTYDENGREIAVEFFDADGQKTRNEFGYCRTEAVRNKFGNVLSQKYFDEQNALCNHKDGYAQVEIQHTSQGFEAEICFLDVAGEPVCNKTEGTHAFRRFYDENGYIERVEYFDTEMRPTYNSSGYFRIEYDDGSGNRPRGEFYFGTDGNPVCEKDSGCFGKLYGWSYETNHVIYVDAEYRPMMSRYGYAEVGSCYDSDGNPIIEAYFDVDGEPIRNKENFASVEYEYDEIGKLIRKVYKDEQEERYIRTGGYAECVFAYDERGNLVSEKYYDTEGNPVVISGGYHEIRREYDDHGNEIRTEYRNVDGNLITNYNTSSCAAVECRYDEYGNVLERSYYDADGQPEQVEGISRISMEYDARGNTVRVVESPYEKVDTPFTRITVMERDDRDNLIRCAFFHTDGQPYPDMNNDVAYLVAYDSQDSPIRYEYFDADGNQTSATEFAYNERHQTIRELYYFPGVEPGSMELAYQHWYSYDDAGTSERLEYRDAAGNLTMCDGNYAVRERGYNMTGEVIEEAFYDENGNRCLYLDDYSILRLEYDALGNKTREMYYDQNEKLFAVNEFSYNNQGWRLSVAYVDGKGNLREVKNTSSRIEYQYDANGWLISRTEYDLKGNAHAVTADLVSIAEVIAGGQAALAGIQAGDLLLKYGDWELFDYANEEEAGDSFQKVAGETRDKEKILVTGRENKDKMAVEFYVIHLGPGTADIRMVDAPRSFEWIEYVYAQYENWKEENGL